MRVMGGVFFGVCLLGLTAVAQQPGATLTGLILDAKTNQPLPFGTIYVNNSTRGTTADANGTYRLTNVPLGTIELVGSALGYQAVRQSLRLPDGRTRTVDLRLEPAANALSAVTVKARHNQAWQRQFRTFSREFFGNRPQARQCRILNPDVLSFQEEKGHLLARAAEPLLIDNEALGYRIHYDLLLFDTYQGRMQFAGASRFEPLGPNDERQKKRWQLNRQTVYQGSLQHLLASLQAGTHGQAGFLVYQTPLTGDGADQLLPVVRTADRKSIDSQQAQSLFKPGDLPGERRLVSEQPLEVYYNRIYAANSPYRDSPFAYSMLLLNGQVALTTNGWITQGNGLDVRGYMGNDRLATLLPSDWTPPSGELVLENSITAGRAARPNQRLDSLIARYQRRYQRLAPLVFVQTDKTLYGTGDPLWLSAYVLDIGRQLPLTDQLGIALEVELIAPTGRSILHQFVPVRDGRAATGFRLPDSLLTGPYRLRVSTSRDLPADGPAFECTVQVINPNRPDAAKSVEPSVTSQPVANQSPLRETDSLDVQFLPEGGRWLAGVPGRLGIKVLQPNGRGGSIRGRIVDQSGQEVASFQTNGLGMGQVMLTPQPGHQYVALFTNHLTKKPQSVGLPPVEAEGWSLAVDATSDSSRLGISVRATGRYSQQPVYVTLQNRGQLVYRQLWQLTKGEARFSLSTTSLPPGVCRITLWDTTSTPRAERLAFVAERAEPVQMRVTLAKPRYEPRETIGLGFRLQDADGNPVEGIWSASVTDADQIPVDTTQSNLRTHLLLMSELRGQIESPAYYMEPDHRTDLDNLLLTQGWRRLPAPQPVDSTGGWHLSGRVFDRYNKPMAGASILVSLERRESKALRTMTTNARGQFRLTDLTLTDTVTVRAQVPGEQGNGTRIIFDQPGGRFAPPPVVVTTEQPPATRLAEIVRRQAAWPALYRDSTARQLAEVVVRASKPAPERPRDVERSSLHGAPDHVFVVQPGVVFVSMGDLIMRVPSLASLKQRNLSSFGDNSPLYLLDGMYTDWPTLKDMDPSDISRVELLKNPATASIYGARSANGVIALYTRKEIAGSGELQAGTLPVLVAGFVSPRQFYVPRYTASSTDTYTDRRDVLFWEPLGQTDANGLGRLTFPLSDTARRLRIDIQGISNTGVPIVLSWEVPVR